MMLRRRRVPRQNANWFGKCLVHDDPEGPWYECRVVDISMLGAGVEIFGSSELDLVGGHLAVEVEPPDGRSFSIQFVGEIKNVGLGPRGRVRVGLEFVDLSDSERSIVTMLEQMHMGW
jgi:hypothetical protein